MDTKTIERKYALIKLGAGDWGLPGNDGETMWRVVHSTDPWPREHGDVMRTTWCIYLCRYTVREIREDQESDRGMFSVGSIDLDDWDSWEYEHGGFDSRKEAIQQALELEEESAPRAQATEEPPRTPVQDAIRSMVAKT